MTNPITVFNICTQCGGSGEVKLGDRSYKCTVCQGTGLVGTEMTAQELKDAGVIADSHQSADVKTADIGDR